MSKLHQALIGLVAFFVVSGCTMPHTKIYSLYLPAEKKAADEKTDASVSIVVRSPRYLSQPYIAYRKSPYQLDISRYDKWDSAPSDMVRDAFRESFSASGAFKAVRASGLIPEGFYSVEIELRKFERLDTHGAPEGALDLAFTISSPSGQVLYQGELSKRIKLSDASYLGLAQALSSGLKESIDEVKDRTVKITAKKV